MQDEPTLKGALHHLFINPKDFDKSIAFYTQELGCEVVSSWGGEKGPRGAVLDAPFCLRIIVAEEHESHNDQSWVSGVSENRPTFHIAVENVERCAEQFRESPFLRIPREKTHWGTEWVVVSDPDNNLYAFFSGEK